MEIWIIHQGEKRGPMREFELRRMAEQGEIDATTKVWHSYLDDWKLITEVDGLRHLIEPATRDFEERDSEDQEHPTPQPETPRPTPHPTNLHLGRRFWARWLDLHFYSGMWWLLMWAAGQDIGLVLANPTAMLLLYVPWFGIEAVLIHHFATTPGKWILGLRVLNADGSKLSLGPSIWRAARVLVLGIAMGIQLFVIICQALNYMTTKKFGITLWDRAGNHRVEFRPVKPIRKVTYIAALMAALWLQSITLIPYVMPSFIQWAEENQPALAEHIKNNPPWHLPKR